MCDMRGYPKVQEIATGKILNVKKLVCNATTYDMSKWGHVDLKDVKEEAIYHICATGGFYSYFDGEKWYSGYDDEWDHQRKYSEGNSPYRAITDKYRFVFDDEDPYSILPDLPQFVDLVWNKEKGMFEKITT